MRDARPARNPADASLIAGWVCVALYLVARGLVPYAGALLTAPLLVAAFVLGILTSAKGRTFGGVLLLLASSVVGIGSCSLSCAEAVTGVSTPGILSAGDDAPAGMDADSVRVDRITTRPGAGLYAGMIEAVVTNEATRQLGMIDVSFHIYDAGGVRTRTTTPASAFDLPPGESARVQVEYFDGDGLDSVAVASVEVSR